jgi:hypothetical protein
MRNGIPVFSISRFYWLRSVDFPSVRSCQMVWVVKHWLPEYNILVRLTLCVWALYI